VASERREQSLVRDHRRPLFQRVADSLFGYDYFISYAWADGRAYAVALARELQQMGFECFLDSKDYAIGDDWRAAGRRAIRKTSRLILVGSPGALASEPVLRELEAFRRTGRRVEPIDFAGTLLFPSRAVPLLEYLPPHQTLVIREEAERLTVGPSLEALQRLRASFNVQRQETKRLRWISIIALVLAALLIAAITQRQEAVRQRRVAEQESQEAVKQTREAERQAREPEKQRQVAEQQTRLTERQRQEAEKQRQEAEKQRLEAEKQRDIALANRAARDRQEYIRSIPVAIAEARIGHFEFSRGILTALAPAELNWEWTYAYLLADPSLYVLGVESKPTELAGYPYSLRFDERGRLSLVKTATGQVVRGLGTLATRAAGWTPPTAWDTRGSSRRAARTMDGSVTAYGNDDGSIVLAHGDETTILRGHTEPVLEVAFSPDGSVLASRCGFELLPPDRSEPDDRAARLWRVSDGKLLATLADGNRSIEHLAFSPDGHHLLTAHLDDIARLWESPSGRLLARLRGHERHIHAVAFSADGSVILTDDGREVRIWPNRSDQEATPIKSLRLPERTFSVQDLEVPGRPGVAEREVRRDGEVLTLREHNGNGWRDVRGLSRRADKLLHLSISSDGRRALGVFDDGRAEVWDLATGRRAAVAVGGHGKRAASPDGHTEDLFAAVMLRDGRRLLTLSEDGLAKLWRLADGTLLRTIDWAHRRAPLRAGEKNFHQTDFHRLSRDHRLLAIKELWNSGTPIQVWNLDTGALVSLLSAEGRDLKSAAFNADGTRIVTASDVIRRDYSTKSDPAAIVWDTASGEELLTLRPEREPLPIIRRPQLPEARGIPYWDPDYFDQEELDASVEEVTERLAAGRFDSLEFSEEGGSVYAIVHGQPDYRTWTWEGMPPALMANDGVRGEALLARWRAWRLVSYLESTR
jgi:WD40 repeat protein